jgi:hypothetical protein
VIMHLDLANEWTVFIIDHHCTLLDQINSQSDHHTIVSHSYLWLQSKVVENEINIELKHI